MKKYNIPKPYLSYSAFSLWKKDIDAFRRRYYLGEKPFETSETIFGKKIATLLENKIGISGLVVYPSPEHKIEVDLKGLKLLGYIDSFDEVTLSFREYKTGHLSPKGTPPWDKVKVHKHEQLVFYSMLIEMKYGKVNPICHLDWLETKFISKSMDFDGHTLEAQSRDLELTGKIMTFERRVFKWEREKMKKDIIKIAKEISKDYDNFKKADQRSDVKTGQAR